MACGDAVAVALYANPCLVTGVARFALLNRVLCVFAARRRAALHRRRMSAFGAEPLDLLHRPWGGPTLRHTRVQEQRTHHQGTLQEGEESHRL